MKRRKRYRPRLPDTYSLIDELRASPTEPMPTEWRRHQLTRVYEGLHALETAAHPADDDLRVVTDAVNLLETLVGMGWADDSEGTLPDAMRALATAFAKARVAGKPLRISGEHLEIVRGALADYATLLNALPARVMIRVHRKTEQRIQEILRGRHLKHDMMLEVPA